VSVGLGFGLGYPAYYSPRYVYAPPAYGVVAYPYAYTPVATVPVPTANVIYVNP
jgi:hypothetical protein